MLFVVTTLIGIAAGAAISVYLSQLPGDRPLIEEAFRVAVIMLLALIVVK